MARPYMVRPGFLGREWANWVHGDPAAGLRYAPRTGVAILADFASSEHSMASALPQPPRTFQDLIFALQKYWSERGCIILQPYDMEMGAGTFHAATFLRAVGPEPWSAAYVQPS